MRDTSYRHWHRWRITHAAPATALVADRFGRSLVPAGTPPHSTCTEKPGADGIRHELVERIRREIAAGTYDTEEKWLAAEAELLRRIEERM